MDGDKIGSIVLGAALTLLATLLIQAIVVPWVQARIRRRERWEEDVRETAILLEERLPRTMLDYHSEARFLLLIRDVRSTSGSTNLEDAVTKAREDVGKARESLEIELHRVRLIPDRLRRLNKGSPHWKALATAELHFTAAWVMASFPISADDGISADDWDSQWQRVEKARKALTATVTPLANSMRPPSRQLPRRLGSRLAMSFKSITMA